MSILTLKVLPQPKEPTVEAKLHLMKDLKLKIKEMQAYFDLLKGEVIEEHFNNSPEYITPQGLLLASYKLSERTTFSQSKFKAEHEDLYHDYLETQACLTFLLK